jgi:hypothetical protein
MRGRMVRSDNGGGGDVGDVRKGDGGGWGKWFWGRGLEEGGERNVGSERPRRIEDRCNRGDEREHGLKVVEPCNEFVPFSLIGDLVLGKEESGEDRRKE